MNTPLSLEIVSEKVIDYRLPILSTLFICFLMTNQVLCSIGLILKIYR